MSPPERRLRVLAVLLGAGATALVFLIAVIIVVCPNTDEWHSPKPPSAAKVRAARAAAPAPTYWFGPRTTAALSGLQSDSLVGPALVYGERCAELDPGSGDTCLDHGYVYNMRVRVRVPPEFPQRRSCWHRFHAAWVTACRDPAEVRLWAGDRVAEFDLSHGRLAELGELGASEPWTVAVRKLVRFDTGPFSLRARFPRTARFTCAERRRLGHKQRAALPPELRAVGCATPGA